MIPSEIPSVPAPRRVGEPLTLGPRSDQLLRQSRAAHAHVEESALVEALLRSDAHERVMVDVGANRGFALAPFAERGWRVHAFEPEPRCRAQLEARFLGLKHRVSVDPRALGARPASGVPFFTSEESSGISTLSPFRDSHERAGQVDVTTLAAYAEEVGLERVDFLKIDTEGHDLFVLEGVPWKTIRPGVILCEFEDAKTTLLGYDVTVLARKLLEEGYVVYLSEWYPIRRYGVPHDWRALKRYPAPLDHERAWGNLLAFDSAPDEGALIEAFRAHTRFRGRADRPDGLRDPAARTVSVVTESTDPSELGAQIATAAYYLGSVVLDELAIIARSPTTPALAEDLPSELREAATEIAPRCRIYPPAEAPRADLVLRDDPREARGAKILLDFAARQQPALAYLRRRNLRAVSGLCRRLGRFDEVRVAFGRGAEPATGVLRVASFDDALMDDVGEMIVVVEDGGALVEESAAGRSARAELVRQARDLDRTVIVPLAVYAHLVGLYPEVEFRLIGLDDGVPWRPHDPPVPTGELLVGTLLPLAALFADHVVVHAPMVEGLPEALRALEPLGVSSHHVGHPREEPSANVLLARIAEGDRVLLDPEGLAQEDRGAPPGGGLVLGCRVGESVLAWFEHPGRADNRVAAGRLEWEVRRAIEASPPASFMWRASTIDALLPALAAGTGLSLWLDGEPEDLEADADAIGVALRQTRALRETRALTLRVSSEEAARVLQGIGGERPLLFSDDPPAPAPTGAERLTAGDRDTLALLADAIRLRRLDGPLRRAAAGRLRPAEDELERAASTADALLREKIAHGRLQRQLRVLDTRVHRADARIAELNEAVEARDRRIGELTAGIAARDARAQELTEGIESRARRIAQLGGAVAARDARVTSLEKAVARLEELALPARRWRKLLSAPKRGARWIRNKGSRSEEE